MPKDFTQFAENPENYSKFKAPKPGSTDPNLVPNGNVYQEISGSYINLFANQAQVLASLITAPFTTMQVSLQLSVLPHKNKYGDVSGVEANKLINIPKEITVQDRRRYELLVKSGSTGTNKPFRAPVYSTYREVFEGLSKQGFLAFYKGNLLGLCHNAAASFTRFELLYGLEYSNHTWYLESSPAHKALMTSIMITIIDTIIHPLQLMQSRFILQNRLQNFSIYKSVLHFFRKTYREPRKFFLGAAVHFPKNLIATAGRVHFSDEHPELNFMLSTQISQTLTYPLMTALRRIHCQDPTPGMLPLRYAGVWHALKLITQEEGIRGIFRGYMAFSVSNLIMALIIAKSSVMADYSYDLQFND